MGVFAWMAVGLIAGVLARAATGSERRGCLFTMVTGIVGGILGGILFNAAGQRGIGEFGVWSCFVAFVGACVLLLALRVLARR